MAQIMNSHWKSASTTAYSSHRRPNFITFLSRHTLRTWRSLFCEVLGLDKHDWGPQWSHNTYGKRRKHHGLSPGVSPDEEFLKASISWVEFFSHFLLIICYQNYVLVVPNEKILKKLTHLNDVLSHVYTALPPTSRWYKASCQNPTFLTVISLLSG